MDNNHSVQRTIKIGVTGPSKVNGIPLICKKVRDILFKLDNRLTKTPYTFIIISPLAEGADQILANEIINFKGSDNLIKTSLEVILKNESTPKNSDFTELLNKSSSTKILDDILSEDIYKNIAEEYTHAGQVVVDKCDILIAIMDVKSKGDTAHIVDYAKDQANKPIFIINPNNKESITEINTDYYFKSLEYQDIYNNEKIDLKEIQNAKKENHYIMDKMNSLNLDSEQKRLIEENIFEQFLIADLLAINYQSKHYLSTNLVYYFSAASVAIVVIQYLFLKLYPQILTIEAVMMFIIIALLFRNKKKDWHRKWVDYRYLAERLRAAMIFSMVGLECKVLDHLPHQRLSGDWTLNAYESIYEKQIAISHPNLDFREIKKFVLNQWIKDQMEFYRKKSIIHLRKDKILNILVYLAFIGALIGAIIHTFAVLLPENFEIPAVLNIMTFVVIVFPAIAASIAGIRNQHEYLRISKRYDHMESYLCSVEYKIRKMGNNDKEKLIKLLENANKMMLREHQDWRIIFSSREPELP